MYGNIKKEMKRHGLDYKSLARIAEVKSATIATRMIGATDFKLPELIKLANYFGCSIDYLVGREEGKENERE